jgi:hypothetical protein
MLSRVSMKTKEGTALWVATVSDVHLGHRTTSTQHILKNLDIAFPDNAETAKLDIIFINGDFFDRQLQLSDPNVIDISMWINRFLRMCKKHNIKVRVLEGTPLHDWGQNALFVTQNETGHIGCDLVYHKRLDIEYIADIGIHVLYVPDEWKSGPDDAWKDTCQRMAELGLTQVDYAMMHGHFPHQMPDMVTGSHDPERYRSIVRCAISVGHVHHQSQWENIFAQGSFDRLSQGYETDKGHYRFYDTGDIGPLTATFVVNKGAKVYTTIDCRGLSLEEFFGKLEACPDYPMDSYLRIYCKQDDPALAAMSVVKKKYPQYNWTTPKIDKQALTVREVQEIVNSRFTPVTMSRDNASEIIMRHISKRTANNSVLDRCRFLLNEAIR